MHALLKMNVSSIYYCDKNGQEILQLSGLVEWNDFIGAYMYLPGSNRVDWSCILLSTSNCLYNYRADECGPVFVCWVLFIPYVIAAHPDIIKV